VGPSARTLAATGVVPVAGFSTVWVLTAPNLPNAPGRGGIVSYLRAAGLPAVTRGPGGRLAAAPGGGSQP